MHIEKILTSYSYNPNTGEYWGRKEVSVYLNEGDNADDANKLSEEATLKYLASMPSPTNPTISTKTIDSQKIIDTEGYNIIMEGIEKCSTPEQLSKEWGLVAARNKTTQQAFDKRLAQLQLKPKGKKKINLP